MSKLSSAATKSYVFSFMSISMSIDFNLGPFYLLFFSNSFKT